MFSVEDIHVRIEVGAGIGQRDEDWMTGLQQAQDRVVLGVREDAEERARDDDAVAAVQQGVHL